MLDKLLLARFLVNIASLIFCFSLLFFTLWRNHWKLRYQIRFIFIPFYDKIENEYNAKYPTVMDNIYSSCFDIDARYNLNTFFFVSESSFHIISKIKSDLHIEIPFDSVIYQDTELIAMSQYDYDYRIALKIMVDNKAEDFSFTTLDYNHKIDKKYGSRLTGEEIYNFVRDNFMQNESYSGC